MYPLNTPVRLSMSISVFCVFLSACGGGGEVTPPELGNKTEVPASTTGASKKSSVLVLDTLKAFPTAEGAGAGASGGRGGKVIYVTNTNESGEGSLLNALIGYGNQKRTIIFAVGGRFNVSEWNWAENKGNFTLAAQTAHNLGGVHIVSSVGENGDNGSIYLTHGDNMIIRYVSAKGGWESGTDVSKRFVALGTQYCTNVVYDHYSSGFSSYHGKIGGINKYSQKAGNVTMQYSLGHEGVSEQNVGMIMGSYVRFISSQLDIGESEAIDIWRNGFGSIDSHHNAYIMNTHRHTGNIYAGETGHYKRISNYIYGVGSRLDSFVGKPKVDYVNNVYESSPTNDISFGNLHKFEISYAAQPEQDRIETSLHFSGNQVIKKDGSNLIGPNDDQWKMVQMKLDDPIRSVEDGTPIRRLSSGDSVPKVAPYYRSNSLSKNKYPITVTPTKNVKDYVLKNAGAGVRFNADGSTYNNDTIDKRYVSFARNKTGPESYSSNVGDGGLGDAYQFSFPIYTTEQKSVSKFDKDRNGLPDAWEQKHKVSNANATKVNWTIQGYTIKNNAGYTNLEMYLAELAGDFHMLAKK